MAIEKKYDTFINRFVASIIDGLVFVPFTMIGMNFQYPDTSNYGVIGWNVFYMACWSLYSIIGHGRFGQTLGKKMMKIKVLDTDEKSKIGFKRAFYRDSFYIIAYAITLAYFLMKMTGDAEADQIVAYTMFSDYMDVITVIWFILEMTTMFLNDKRRAIHDLLAGSVVIDMREKQKEEMRKQNNDLLTTFH